jgi:putative transcriptional regulator
MINAGTILKSTDVLDDTYFERALLFITETNGDGATGFVVNKLFSRKLNELAEFSHGISFPIYEGGPVADDQLFFIHNRPDLIEGGISVRNRLYFGGNFEQAVSLINKRILSSDNVKVFIGYCGWDTNQLEAEIEEGSWTLVSNNEMSASIFV